MEIKAPAKINLCLKILGRRPDGYHNIFSIMRKVSLYDYILLEPSEKDILVQSDNNEIPAGKDNLAYRAAEIFFSSTGLRKGVRVFIKKRIPSGAGLGGGSSDAAAVLKGLNRIYNTRLKTIELVKMGAEIGSDVPFFVSRFSTVVAEGRGEIMTPVKIPEYWYLLVYPEVHISTAWAYSQFDNVKKVLTNQTISIKLYKFKREAFLEEIFNDLEVVSAERYPVLKKIKKMMNDAGALAAVMTGSGSTMVGIFKSRKMAEEAGKLISKDYWIKIVKGI